MAKGNVVMITGVGRGLGRALAEAFLHGGDNVVGIARDDECFEELSRMKKDGDFLGCVADVTEYERIESAVSDAKERYGRVDVLFNNAAIYPRVNFLAESAEDWARVIEVNLNGVANCCKAVLPVMIEAGWGRIFNIGSFADLSPIQDSAAYSASKGAVRALTKAIAMDLQKVNADVEVHEWIPGHLNTRMSGFSGSDPVIAASWGVRLASMPMGRKKNCIFVNDKEWLPPKRLKQRLKERIFFWRTFD